MDKFSREPWEQRAKLLLEQFKNALRSWRKDIKEMMASMSAASGEHHEGKANEVGWNSDADEAYSEEEERARRKMRERKKTKKRPKKYAEGCVCFN